MKYSHVTINGQPFNEELIIKCPVCGERMGEINFFSDPYTRHFICTVCRARVDAMYGMHGVELREVKA